MAPTVRYPVGDLTPHGAYHVLHDTKPIVCYRSYDDTSVFYLMGGPAIPDRTQPEVILLKELKGLVPPWKPIEQKGATQDGSSFVTALYDPIEIDMTVEAFGRDAPRTRQLIRDWIAAWDAKQPGELSFFTHSMGRWWAPVRWMRAPTDKIQGGTFTRQNFLWSAKAYDGFWRSYDHAAQFRFIYESSSDDFDYTTGSGLGAGWTVAYSGGGSGVVFADGEQVDSTLANGYTAVCRRNSFTTTTDNQVVEIRLGKHHTTWYHPINAYDDIWARMANTGTAGADGVRLRIAHRKLTLSCFVSSVETVLRERPLLVPVQSNERFTLVAGQEDDSRMFTVLRNGLKIMSVKENATSPTSLMGAGYRAAGFGMSATGTVLPPTIRSWSAGDNTTISQTGFIDMINVGDQDVWPRYTCYGPGTFSFANGPGSTDMVEFGPLLPNQIMQVRTDPRKRGVVDLTAVPPTEQEQSRWREALQDIIDFATGNNTAPLLEELRSLFGVNAPQGNPYSLLDGRFSNPIPAKPAGTAAPTYPIKVGIEDGNADSQILAAITPLRRFPY